MVRGSPRDLCRFQVCQPNYFGFSVEFFRAGPLFFAQKLRFAKFVTDIRDILKDLLDRS